MAESGSRPRFWRRADAEDVGGRRGSGFAHHFPQRGSLIRVSGVDRFEGVTAMARARRQAPFRTLSPVGRPPWVTSSVGLRARPRG